MAHPRKPAYGRKNLLRKLILSQISLPWQRGSVGEKCNWRHSMAHPQKKPIVAKISQKSLPRAE